MRALARWGLTPLLATPFGAWALGLGDIELRSALNQPFNAEIDLVSATPEELRGLRIALASRDAFESRGLDRAAFLSALEFRIAKNAAGQDVVQISSRESITEPFVTMLVEMTWPRGRLLREYTVLLDPPVLLPGPAVPTPVQPAQTRQPEATAPRPIERPAPPAPQPQPGPQPGISNAPPPAPRAPERTPGTYGPVQRAETLWAIAERFRPAGVSMNQMMVAVYQSNPQAFAGNMNVLQVGAVLRIPDATQVATITSVAATAEVARQTDEWRGRPAPQAEARLRLLPPAETPEPAPPPAPAVAAVEPRPPPATREQPPASPDAAAPAAAEDRLLEVRDEQLSNLQEQLAAEEPLAAPAEEAPEAVAPGVDLESEQLFVEEDVPEPEPEPVAEAPAPAPVAAPAAPVATEPSLMSRILGVVMAPLLWIVLGVGALVVAALWFVRRRREEPEDVTGRWEALESEVDDDEVREATERMRRQVADDSIVVEEQSRPRRAELDVDFDQDDIPRAARAERAPAPGDDTLSSQTVINLDQADPVAEADFHMAYGLYDQAAELVSKALEAQPNRRDLKLKLLEVFFVWGNKDAFLKAAKSLRKELGESPDADWDKVIIMGKQICPDEPLFAEAASAGAHVDLDLQAGDSPLDLAFDDASDGAMDLDLAASGDDRPALNIESSGQRRQREARVAERDSDDSLDIGERTAAGLEAALFFQEDDDTQDVAGATSPDIDSLAVTQESPTIETPKSGRDWERVTAEQPTIELAAAEAPTVETPTIETAAADAPTMETPTIETAYRAEPPTVEQPAFASAPADHTAEIDLDDLGLDVEDLAGLPTDLGELPDGDSDTRQQRALNEDDALLSATGVTQVLRADDDDDEFEQRKTAVLADDDATMLAPSGYDDTLTGTEVLSNRMELDESGDTSLVKSLRTEDGGLDLNLDDLSAALQGNDTVEQPRSTFGRDIFGDGDTPIDLDIGSEIVGADDPTGTEEVSPLDPQTMTEVGTKLDLARAYIDMGDPEGARSILEEVLDEGDPSQRREAQSLIEVLSA